MSEGTPPLPPKKEVALHLLEASESVFVHLDPRQNGVLVPKWFTNQPQLVLQIGLNMPLPIPDLRVEDTGISCTLSFNRSPFWCRLPWSAVFALVGQDRRGMVWPDDVPPEIAHQIQGSAPQPRKQKPRLQAVPKARDSEGAHEGARPIPIRPNLRDEPQEPQVAGAETFAPAVERPALRSVPAPPPDDPTPSPAPEETAAPPPLAAVPAPPPDDPTPLAASATGSDPKPAEGEAPRPNDEIFDDDPKPKKKRELPPYLRVIK